MSHLSSLMTSLFGLFIVISLLLNFVMVGSRWIKNYIIAFTAECWIIGFLSFGIAFFSHITDLYIVGFLTIVFRGVVFPIMLMKMVRKLNIQRELHMVIPASTGIFISILLVIFSYLAGTHLMMTMNVNSTLLILALVSMFSIKLLGFLLLSIRDQAISKILALLVLENGIFLGSLFLVPEMPIFVELVILFDLLIVVASFGVLVNYINTHIGSTSTKELTQLVG